jgi:hypothetical protein
MAEVSSQCGEMVLYVYTRAVEELEGGNCKPVTEIVNARAVQSCGASQTNTARQFQEYRMDI